MGKGGERGTAAGWEDGGGGLGASECERPLQAEKSKGIVSLRASRKKHSPINTWVLAQ